MKYTTLGIAALLALAVNLTAFVPAYATPGGEGNNSNCNGQGNANSPCGGSTPSTGGSAVSASRAEARATALAIAAQRQAQQQAQAQRQAQRQAHQQNQGQGQNQQQNNTVSPTITSNANPINNIDARTERSAPAVSAVAPVQVRNCRLGLGAGGSNSSGGLTAAIIIGNDQTCLAGAKLEAMQVSGGFSTKSKQKVACTIEGMDELPECKELAEEKRSETQQDYKLLP